MRLLLDTHMVLWVAAQPERLPPDARDLVEDWRNNVFFSPISLWEIAIKSGLEATIFWRTPIWSGRDFWRTALRNWF